MSAATTQKQDFRSGTGAWPTESASGDISTEQAYRVAGQEVVLVSPWDVPSDTGPVIEAQLTLEEGSAGVFCRGSDDGETGYRLTVSDAQEFRLERRDAESRSTLAEGTLPDRVASQPGEPMLLRLMCREAEGKALIGMTFNASSWQRVTDPDPFDAPSPTHLGLVVDGIATFDGVALLDLDE